MKKLILFTLLCYLGMRVAPSSGQDKKKEEKKAAPRVVVIVPLGASAGETNKVTLRGLKLDDATEVRILDDKGTAKIVSKGKASVPDKNPDQVGDTQVVVEVALKPKLPSGPVQVVVVTAAGEAKPHPLLVETTLPVLKEKEPNDGFRQAQEIKLPVMVEGALDRPRDVDVFKFEGKAGQKIVLEVLAARYGSPLDSILTLYTSAGAQVASSDDTQESVDSKLAVTLPAAGIYYVVLMDAHDAGSPVHVYRLLMK